MCGKKILRRKILFRSKKICWPENYSGSKKNFGSKKLFGSKKKLWVKKNFRSNFLGALKKFFGSTFFWWVVKIFGSWNFFGSKHFFGLIRSFLIRGQEIGEIISFQYLSGYTWGFLPYMAVFQSVHKTADLGSSMDNFLCG